MQFVLNWLVLPLVSQIVTPANVNQLLNLLLGLLDQRAAQLNTPLGKDAVAELRAFVQRQDVAGFLASALDQLLRGTSAAALPAATFDPAQPPAPAVPPSPSVGPIRRALQLLTKIW